MWVFLAFLSASLLGFYDVFKKKSLAGNAVLPVLMINTVVCALFFIPFIVASSCGWSTIIPQGLLIYGEQLNGWQWAGVLLALLSFFLLSRSGKREGIRFSHNIWIALLVRNYSAVVRMV